MLYIYCLYCITTVIYMSQKGLMQAGGVFRCPSGVSCWTLLLASVTRYWPSLPLISLSYVYLLPALVTSLSYLVLAFVTCYLA